MALREIVNIPDPVLRRKAHKVTEFDKEFQTLVDDMVETMRAAPGVGLAASQVSISIRLIVVEYGEDEDEEAPNKAKKLYVVANPEIIHNSIETEIGNEACLSVPGLVGEVERFSQVVVRGKNRRGQPVRINVHGWKARIFQHEIDHCDGILFTDRATHIWKPMEDEKIVVAD
jgi:peptide deformylase